MQNNMEKQSDSLNPILASVPLPPDELLREEIAHWLSNFYYRLNNWECSIMPKTYYDSEKPLLLKREAEALLAKCRQSEAAEIKELIREIHGLKHDLIASYSEIDRFSNRIEELKVELAEALLNVEELKLLNQNNDKAIRADQNKKIGEWLSEWRLKEHNISSVLLDLIAKLQKGEF
jgi:hypothetical protein